MPQRDTGRMDIRFSPNNYYGGLHCGETLDVKINLLLLNKFDYTRHPMSKEMVRASIMDYCPRTSYAPTPQTGSENEPDKKPQRESRGRKLSRSDTPPVEF